jgi:hypothetical protein
MRNPFRPFTMSPGFENKSISPDDIRLTPSDALVLNRTKSAGTACEVAQSVGDLGTNTGVLASIAEFERARIQERTHAGLARARAHGKRVRRRHDRPEPCSGDIDCARSDGDTVGGRPPYRQGLRVVRWGSMRGEILGGQLADLPAARRQRGPTGSSRS